MMCCAIGARRAGGAAVLMGLCGLSAGALAQDYTWAWTRPAGWGHNAGVGQGIMDAGGRFESQAVLYNPTTKRLRYSITLSEQTATYSSVRPAPPKLTEGFTLMMDNGSGAFGNPSTPSDPQKRGILAQLFVEGYNPALDNPGSTAAMWNGSTYEARVSAYAWNGKRIFGHPWRNEDSFADGFASVNENTASGSATFYDAPHRLMTSVNGGRGADAFSDARVTNNVTVETVAPGVFRDKYTRTFTFDMNVALIKDFNPAGLPIEQAGMAWYGIGMGDGDGTMAPPDRLGMWMRTYKYVRDSIPSPDSSTPLLPDFTGATLAGVDYWDLGEAAQFGTIQPGDPRLGFIRDYELLAGGQIDRLGWETAGPGEDVFPFDTARYVGFFDVFGQVTTVPAPGTAGVLALAGVVAARRRRRCGSAAS